MKFRNLENWLYIFGLILNLLFEWKISKRLRQGVKWKIDHTILFFIPALRKLWQEIFHEQDANLGY